jgi:hypothetical protein
MSLASERHFSVPEISELWNLSDDKIRAIFKDEPGVVRIGIPERMHKRGYITLRIPQSVLDRVHQRLRGRAA